MIEGILKFSDVIIKAKDDEEWDKYFSLCQDRDKLILQYLDNKNSHKADDLHRILHFNQQLLTASKQAKANIGKQLATLRRSAKVLQMYQDNK